MKKKKLLLAILPLLALGLSVPVLRTPMLHLTLEKSVRKLEQNFGLKAEFRDPSWTAWNKVGFSRIELVKVEDGSGFTAEFPEIRLSIASLMSGNARIKSLSWYASEINIEVSGENEDENSSEVINPFDLARESIGMITRAASVFPENLDLKRNKISWTHENGSAKLFVDELSLENKWLRTRLLLDNVGEEVQSLLVSGEFDPNEGEFDLLLGAENGEGFHLPFAQEGRELGISAAHFRMSKDEEDSGELIQGSYSLVGLYLKDPSLSESAWLVPEVSGEFKVKSDAEALAASFITEVSGLITTQRLFMDRTSGLAQMDLELPEQSADLYVKALPEGSMYSLEGMELEGNLGGRFSLKFDALGRVWFEGEMEDSALAVASWGPADLGIMNGNFTHLPWREDRIVRVGTDGKDFVPLQKIPEQLLKCLLLSEDVNFYGHEGFDESAVALAVRTNLQEGRFARGGSTLSMQLVRNVFLGQEKTLDRKLEEVILTCLMERTRVLEKDRVLEVYLNVIEWGEGIYGIRQASRHYFGKEPGALDLNEALFLTGIIPNPREYDSFLDDSGQLSGFGEAYYAGMAFLLFEEGDVSEAELDALSTPQFRADLLDWASPMGTEAMSGIL